MLHDSVYQTNTCGTSVLATLKFLQKFQEIIRAFGSVVFKINFAFAHIILSAVHSVYLFHIVFSVCFPCRHCSPSANLQTGPLASFLSLCISTNCRLSICLLPVCLSVCIFNVHPDKSGCRSSFKALHLFKGSVT